MDALHTDLTLRDQELTEGACFLHLLLQMETSTAHMTQGW